MSPFTRARARGDANLAILKGGQDVTGIPKTAIVIQRLP